MSIPNELKKQIADDWLKEFAQLIPYAQNKLYKVVGPMVAGIELVKLPNADKYRPIFVGYPLWKSNEKECFNESYIQEEINNKKGMQLDIPYNQHDTFFREAVECVRKQIPVSLEEDVSINTLFAFIDHQFSNILVRSSPVQQAKLFECKVFGALYTKDSALTNKVLDEVTHASGNWAPNLFEWKFGKVDQWLEGIRERVSRPDEFIDQVTTNKQDKKIGKLNRSELIA